MKFNQLKLETNLLKGIEKAGYTDCTPVQEKTFEQTLNGKDVLAQSQTGTGKTAAFLISIFQLLLTDKTLQGKQALIVAPTRELAFQIEAEAKLLSSFLDFKVGTFIGGMSYTSQEKMIADGVNIVIGTPGRLIDLNRSNKLSFKNMGFLVIDEADLLFDMGFLPDIRKICRKMPHYSKRRTMLFSATLNYRAQDLAWEYMNSAEEIRITPDTVTVENITQEIYHVGKDEKISLLLGLLQRENPENCLIFTNTKHAAEEVAFRLENNGYNCHYIMGDLPQKKRLRIIEDVKSGKIPFLVATNVAARGLHIDDLDLVVNYDLPLDCEDYVHRIGRTARAGKSGKAISLACETYVFGLQAIEKFTHMKIPVSWADDELFVKDKSAGMRFIPRDRSHGHPKGPKTKTGGPRHPRGTSRNKGTTTSSMKTTRTSKASGGPSAKKSTQKRKTATPKDMGSMTSQERIDYYSKKYGDTFKSSVK